MRSGEPAPRATRAASFGEVAEDYDRWRPAPPPEAVDWLLPAGATDVLDVGAGTGKLTRLLLDRVAGAVVAAEPDLRMGAVLARRSPRALLLAARGEQLPVRGGAFDALFVSSAWHWLDPAAATREAARVQRPGGRLAVLWNGPDREVGWLGRVLGHAPGGDGAAGPRPERAVGGSRHRLELPPGAPFSEPERHGIRWTLPMSAAELVGLAATYSGVITRPPAERDAWLAAAGAAAGEIAGRRPDGIVEVPMGCRCWRADRR